jgi:hypothetical protein
MVEVLDISRDTQTGKITQFLILADDGQPETKLASPENLLLYDPENELPFDGGMRQFLEGDSALRLREEPKIVVGQAGDEYMYSLSVNDSVVETTPKQADKLLRGVYEAIASDKTGALETLHRKILKNQVRRDIVNILAQTFEERHRITVTQEGWLVDDFYLVDWNASMYSKDDDPDEADYVRDSAARNEVTRDKSYEMVRLRYSLDVKSVNVEIDGRTQKLSEREMLFLAKIKWLLHRHHYHPDTPFWAFADKWACVEEEEPNIDAMGI